MLLYHGSNTDIKEINLAMCRPYKDFGVDSFHTQKAISLLRKVSD